MLNYLELPKSLFIIFLKTISTKLIYTLTCVKNVFNFTKLNNKRQKLKYILQYMLKDENTYKAHNCLKTKTQINL